MTGHNSQKLIRSFADRIMRLKAEQDDIGHDIREVYKEAHGNGLDKTILGQLVGYLRKREKHGAIRADEQASLLQVYIDAYEESLTGTVIATRVCEPPPHNPITGELHEPSGAVLANSPEQAGEGCESRRVAPEDTPAAELTEPAGPALPRPEQQAGAVIPHDHAAVPAAPTESDGGAFGAVKAQGRLPDAVGVEPPPSDLPELPEFLRRKKVAA